MRNFKSFSRAAPVITKSSHEVSSYPLLDAFGWEKLISNRKKHKAITVFKSLPCSSVSLLNILQIQR